MSVANMIHPTNVRIIGFHSYASICSILYAPTYLPARDNPLIFPPLLHYVLSSQSINPIIISYDVCGLLSICHLLRGNTSMISIHDIVLKVTCRSVSVYETSTLDLAI